MKLTIKLKLEPNTDQAKHLLDTIGKFNEACNRASRVAFTENINSKFSLQRVVYSDLRASGLGSQLCVRAIAKAFDARKRDKKRCHTFRSLGATVYDARAMSYKRRNTVSLWTTGGRIEIPYLCGEYQAQFLPHIKGEADLVVIDTDFFLLQTVDVEEAPQRQVDDYLGVDFGITNIATDCDGEIYDGGKLRGIRFRYHHIRQRLQSKGTKSSRRLLVKRRRKEKRFAKDVNHVISKRVVARAEGTSRGIAIENLKGIRKRTTVSRSQRRTHHSWSFYQLRSFIEYKAKRVGIPVVAVDPRNTSRQCPSCGHTSKSNRPSQDTFLCVSCAFSGHADHIAAVNIGRRGTVNCPNADSALVCFKQKAANYRLKVGSG